MHSGRINRITVAGQFARWRFELKVNCRSPATLPMLICTVIGSRQPLRRRARWMIRRLRRLCLNGGRNSASALCLLNRCGVKQVQFDIAQIFDGGTQVPWQHMPLRLARRGGWCLRRRRTIPDRTIREEVRRNLLTAFASHSAIMPLLMFGGNTEVREAATGIRVVAKKYIRKVCL